MRVDRLNSNVNGRFKPVVMQHDYGVVPHTARQRTLSGKRRQQLSHEAKLVWRGDQARNSRRLLVVCLAAGANEIDHTVGIFSQTRQRRLHCCGIKTISI
jgi:hypothetical protein